MNRPLFSARPTAVVPRLLPRHQSSGIREGGEILTFDQTTELKWVAVDTAGNMEGNDDPDGKKYNYRKAEFTIR